MNVKTLERHPCCDGEIRFLNHESDQLGLTARFGIFLPRQALEGRLVPVIHVLAGLTCSEETFLIKSNAVRFAAELGIALVAPDTSPRGAAIEGEEAQYDLGTGAGYYVDATAEPWSRHYRMASYVAEELPQLTEKLFPFDGRRRGVMGHSMGGMGALALALRVPENWKTVSAFAPIAAPSAIAWGQKATKSYFAGDPKQWNAYDPSLLLTAGRSHPSVILVDQGMEDEFLADLRPDTLEESAKTAGQPLRLRRHAGYDHSYWFVQSFIEDHLRHHAKGLVPALPGNAAGDLAIDWA